MWLRLRTRRTDPTLAGEEVVRFHDRFQDGRASAFPRVTTEETLRLFPRRQDGLRILFITASIREWSFPNIIDLGKSFIASVAYMDGHDCRVLDLNAERGGPVEADDRFRHWVD